MFKRRQSAAKDTAGGPATQGRLVRGVPVALFLLRALSATGALPAEPGLVAHYTFEEGPAAQKVKDWSAQGNDGTITGNVTYIPLAGDQGYALRFNDGQAYVNCGNDPSMDLREAVTIALWFYPETGPVPGTEPGLAGKGFRSYVLTYAGNCWFYVGDTGNGVSGDGPPPTSSWYHVAATFDGKELKIYLDGALVGTRASKSGQIPPTADAFYLRYPVLYGSNKDLPFTCLMDDVRVYNRALSADELLQQYRKDRNWRKGRKVAAGKMSVRPRVYATLSKLRVEVDFAGLQPVPRGTTLTVELVDPASGKVADRYQTAELPASDMLVAVLDTSHVAPGDYEVRTGARDHQGKEVGSVAAVSVTLAKGQPDRPPADPATKSLNNLVTELLNVPAPARCEHAQYRFTHPREGWVFISSQARPEEGGEIWISLDSAPREGAVIVHRKGPSPVQEAMRHLPAGTHTLEVHAEKGTLNRLAVRAIPELLYAEVGYEPSTFLPGLGPYTWEFLERIGLLNNLNVVLERHPEKDPQEPYTQRWREQGKKVLTYCNLSWLRSDTAEATYDFWSALDGFQRPDRDGIMFDELSGNSSLPAYPGLAEAVRRLSANPFCRGKVLYPYCTSMYRSEPSTTFLWEIAEAGYKFAEEKYLPEQPTAAAARRFLEASLTQGMAQYRAAIPGGPKHTIVCFGYFSAPPESLNTDPSVDYKVYLDLQFHLLANDPAFRGLHGVMCYHSAFADEEIIRWSARLYRHYCIEGKRERLSRDPYVLSHLRNPDFAEGSTGWTLSPAEPGSMDTRNVPDYSYLQGRYPKTTQGDTVLWTRRSAQGPNRCSQEIRNLAPGRLYSLKMFTADYQRFLRGNGVAPFEGMEAKREMTIGIEDVDLIPSRSFANTFASGRAGHTGQGFTRENNLPITYRFLVFRARREKAMLRISDWASDTDPGGPIGQELMHNFIEVQPYLED